jgi:hypothetical protein
VVAAFVALGLGRLAVRSSTVPIEIVGGGPVVEITVDGVSRRVDLPLPLAAIRPVAPLAFRREHQIDGSDSTNMFTFAPRYFSSFGATPYYQLQAWLREEWRYSRWTDLEVTDGSGQVLLLQEQPPDEINVPVPPTFRFRIALERPEIPRTLELIDTAQNVVYLEVNRNDKYVRLGQRSLLDGADRLRWYFPRDPSPPLATLFDLVVRVVALALGSLLLVGAVAAGLEDVGCRDGGRPGLVPDR